MDLATYRPLVKHGDTKIVLLVLDGLGGLPEKPDGLPGETGGTTALETARCSNLDSLARRGVCGLHEPVGPGIIPGSGPAHLGLFGYDPLKYNVGRGVLAALGIDFDLRRGDVAARGNFATVDGNGAITDRRAGRISTEKNRELCEKLGGMQVNGVEFIVRPVKEHRFLLIMRGDGLSPDIGDTDPHVTGVQPQAPSPATRGGDAADETAELLAEFIGRARETLAGEDMANMVLLRGFSSLPDWPSFNDAWGLKAAAVATYPMYRGIARLLGMDVLDAEDGVEEEIAVVKDAWDAHDFFFLHVKQTDSSGEDGDFGKKVAVIEEVDEALPSLLDIGPDVVIVTGDHSTPARMKSHSWHPVPVLLWSPLCRADSVERFGERDCMTGGLGARLPATHLMPIALANAGRLDKYGA